MIWLLHSMFGMLLRTCLGAQEATQLQQQAIPKWSAQSQHAAPLGNSQQWSNHDKKCGHKGRSH